MRDVYSLRASAAVHDSTLSFLTVSFSINIGDISRALVALKFSLGEGNRSRSTAPGENNCHK